MPIHQPLGMNSESILIVYCLILYLSYPTYDEIVREDDEEETREQFEVKYNFRFEEPDQDFVSSLPPLFSLSI